MSSAYCRKNDFEKRGHLIAQFHNTEVKWSIKPYILRINKIGKALTQKLVEWIIKSSNVRETPISSHTLLIIDAESGVKQRMPKLLLECSMCN